MKSGIDAGNVFVYVIGTSFAIGFVVVMLCGAMNLIIDTTKLVTDTFSQSHECPSKSPQ